MSIAFEIDFSVVEKGRKAPQWTVNSDLTGEQSLADLLLHLKTSLITIAGEVLREEQGNGFDKDPLVRVDGRVGKPPGAVNPFGSIEFVARQAAQTIVLDAYKAIMERAPFDTGLWKESNFVFVNGAVVATNETELVTFMKSKKGQELADNDIVRIVNVIPYARKLERLGVTGKRVQSRRTKSRDKKLRSGPTILAPNGAYFLAYRAISRLYKSNSKISFSFLPGSEVGLQKVPAFTKSGSPLRRTYKKSGKSYLYPSLKIEISGAGTV